MQESSFGFEEMSQDDSIPAYSPERMKQELSDDSIENVESGESVLSSIMHEFNEAKESEEIKNKVEQKLHRCSAECGDGEKCGRTFRESLLLNKLAALKVLNDVRQKI